MILVLNEWIFHDLRGENGKGRQIETLRFLHAFRYSGDMIVIPSEKRWKDKAFSLMRQGDSRLIAISKLLHSLLLNTDKAAPQSATPEIPTDLLGRLPEEDVYLVSAYIAAGADKLVTTDQGLFDSVADSKVVSCQMRDDFGIGYLS